MIARQNSIATKWCSNKWLSLSPAISEHLIGDTSNPVKYALISRTSPNTQHFRTISTVQHMNLFLNTGLSAEDIVDHATKHFFNLRDPSLT